jgi:TRAP-type C4-dicarboxylate transport system substrate-binding protein
MRLKLWFTIVICLIFSVSLTSSALGADSTKLRFAYSMPAKASPADAWEWWGEELKRQTNGKYEVEYYPLQSLFKVRAAIENIIKGTGDIANISIRTTAHRYPLLSVTMIPTVRWPNDPQGIHDASVAIMKLIDEFPAIQKEVSAFKVLWVLMLTDYYLYTKKPISKPSDLKGMNIGSGGSQAAFVKAQGGGAVGVIPPRSYMNLKTGVIDGMVMSYNAVGHYKIWEVCKYAYEMPMGRVPLPMIMNLESWKAIPKDVQKLMMDLGEKTYMMSAKGMYAGEKKGRVKWANAGRTSTVPTERDMAVWMKAFEPFEKKWLDDSLKAGRKDAPSVLKRWKEYAKAAWTN